MIGISPLTRLALGRSCIGRSCIHLSSRSARNWGFFAVPSSLNSRSAVSHCFPLRKMSSDNSEEGSAVYRPGGFHPVHLGDVYNGKYEVLRKIGYGRYSTVWLVRSQHDGGEKFWALKFLSAECYGGTTKEIYEREVLERLRDADVEHPGHAYISTLRDSFEHEGPNGRHVCLIFDVMGETLRSFGTWFRDHLIPNSVMRRFTIQLLLALDYAHDSGVIHTDIKPDNILVQIKDESLISNLYLPNNPADPAAFEQSTDPSSIKSQPLKYHYFEDSADVLDFDIALGDWGVASWTDSHLSEMIQPVALRAPEVLIKAPWGPSVDLWNLGAVVLEVFRAVRMFSGRVGPDDHYDVRMHLHEIVDFFGPLPRSLLSKGDEEFVKETFDEEGRVKGLPPLDRPPLESDAFLCGLKDEYRADFVAFLKSLMAVDPVERKGTMDLLAEPWLHAVVG